MKFRFEYRTSDNVLHRGEIAAPDRESAFARLKEQGIRPARLEDAPGLGNKIFGKGKRWLAIALLAILVLVFGALALVRGKSAAFVPSERYLELERAAQEILARATNAPERASADLKGLFREKYPALPDRPRERAEAQALYGRIALEIETLDD